MDYTEVIEKWFKFKKQNFKKFCRKNILQFLENYRKFSEFLKNF